MTAATVDRLEELTAERETAVDRLREAADSLDVARLQHRAGKGSQEALEASESRHRAAVGVHAQVVAEVRNAEEDRALSDRFRRLDAMRETGVRRHRSNTSNLSLAAVRAFKADQIAIQRRVELATAQLNAQTAYSQVESLAERYARETGRLSELSSQTDVMNERENVMREWEIPVSPPPYGGLPPVGWPTSLMVDHEQAAHEYNTRMACPVLARLGGLQ